MSHKYELHAVLAPVTLVHVGVGMDSQKGKQVQEAGGQYVVPGVVVAEQLKAEADRLHLSRPGLGSLDSLTVSDATGDLITSEGLEGVTGDLSFTFLLEGGDEDLALLLGSFASLPGVGGRIRNGWGEVKKSVPFAWIDGAVYSGGKLKGVVESVCPGLSRFFGYAGEYSEASWYQLDKIVSDTLIDHWSTYRKAYAELGPIQRYEISGSLSHPPRSRTEFHNELRQAMSRKMNVQPNHIDDGCAVCEMFGSPQRFGRLIPRYHGKSFSLLLDGTKDAEKALEKVVERYLPGAMVVDVQSQQYSDFIK